MMRDYSFSVAFLGTLFVQLNHYSYSAGVLHVRAGYEKWCCTDVMRYRELRNHVSLGTLGEPMNSNSSR